MADFQVSVSHLEGFRLLKTEFWQTEEKLIADIKGDRPPTRKMSIGTAFHSVLENPELHRGPEGEDYVCDGFLFPSDVVAPCLAVFDRRGLFEVPQYTDWTVGGRAMTTAARVDQVIGLDIKENKTKTGYYKPEMFDPSLQWRFYLPMYGARSVTYNVFLLDDKDGTIGLRGIEHATYYPYPGLEGDCREWLGEFAEWAERKGLGPWLKPSWLRPKREGAK
jgi:hypothetical protein